ncbi:MAG: acyl-CoA desaturase [Chitinophagaceae bacterium]|jgi:linoleoyl-CoA desaturase|nr:acyl-CoA desaturase [Chitinophagaceae bacterium]
MALPKFTQVSQGFHAELKKRIADYFSVTGEKPTGNYKLYTKAIILTVSYVAMFTHLVFFDPITWVAVIECCVLGLATAFIGFNIMHDGAHGSFSTSPAVNKLAAITLNVLGGSAFMWNIKHNIIHHAYTNVDGVDDDIDAGIMLRMARTQKKLQIHKFQHLYFWVLYSILYIYWIFVSDYRKYFRGKIGDLPLKKMHLSDHLAFWGYKMLHLTLFVALPIITHGFSEWLVGFLIFTTVAGFILSIVFQLAHTVEHTHFPMPDEAGRMEDEWAIHQVKTTANFATNNKLVSWCVGGLNFQVEHHLFPKISHIHYPVINRIVKQTCKEYGVEYIEYPTVSKAIRSHINYLREMGKAA